MINSEKIGVGIITKDRSSLLEKLLVSLEPCINAGIVDHVIVVNDGDKLPDSIELGFDVTFTTNTQNLGVGKCKNIALRYLQEHEVDHFFLIEDDIFIKNPDVFEKYIEAARVTGIQHFNFSQHGVMNKTFDGKSNPDPRKVVDYGTVKIGLYPHCVGAFSYYSKLCLDTAGLLDEEYFNACEHVDHTYGIIKAGLHPSFWYFADIDESWEYLGDEPWSIQTSTISSNANHKEIMKAADAIFVKKHDCYPFEIPSVNIAEVGAILKDLVSKYRR